MFIHVANASKIEQNKINYQKKLYRRDKKSKIPDPSTMNMHFVFGDFLSVQWTLPAFSDVVCFFKILSLLIDD